MKEYKNKIQAKVILAKCPYAKSEGGNLFGMRIQKFGSEWKRTWAFKIDATKARHEGYDAETASISGDTEEYPGCPYCGTTGFVRCACGKCFCDKTKIKKGMRKYKTTCPWCGETGEVILVDAVNVSGGGY